MTQFKYDPTIDEKYNNLVFSLFEGTFEDKKDLLKETAIKVGEEKDYKVLCVITHLFADTMLTDEYIRKGWWNLETFKSYVYFMKLVDTFIELPKSYFNNELVYETNGDVYFNYYVALRTLYDHSIIPYEDSNYLYGDVTSFATSIQEEFHRKPYLLNDENDELINKTLEEYKEISNKNLHDLFLKTYHDYLNIKNKNGNYDRERGALLDELNQTLKEYNDTAFDELTYKIIKSEDIVSIIYFTYEFIELSNVYASRFGKYRSWFLFNKVQDTFANFYTEDPTQKIPMWNKLDVDYVSYISLFMVLLKSFADYIHDATKFEIELVKSYKSELIDLQNNMLKVNKFYTDILGKGMDSFFYNFLNQFFNPSDDLVNFATEFTKFEINPLCLIWMQLSFYNNCNSSYYGDDLIPLLTNSMDAIYYPENEIEFVPLANDQFENAGALQCELFNAFKDNYIEIYGARVNPLKDMKTNETC